MSTGFNPPLLFLRAYDHEGLPAPGAKLYHRVAGTELPKAIYYDAALTSECPQPLVADSEGRFPQFFLEGGAYRFVLFDADDVQLRPPEDPIWGANGGSIFPTPTNSGFLYYDEGTDTYSWIQVEGAKVKVDADDPVAGYLSEKLTDSDTIHWEVLPDHSGIHAVVQEGVGDTYKVKLDADDAVPGYLDEKMADATDVQFTPKSGALDSIVYQLTGIGARLLPVKTDFEWAGWVDGYLYGGRGISPGYAWVGEVGSQKHVRVWRANDAGAHMYQTSDNWATTVHDTSAVALLIGTRPPCLKYATVYGVASWILTSNTTGDWWYAQDIAANYNADGSLKVAAWVHSTNVAPHQIADISESSGVFCLVGNHGYITKTTNLTAFLDVYSGPGVIGGIDNDRTGKWIAVGRDTGAIIMSLDNGDTWTLPAVYIRDDEEGEYVTPSSNRMAAGCVTFGNGIWLITSSSGTEYFWSEDGIHWTAGQNPMGTFYGVASDGVRFYATNPYKVGTGAQQVVYRLLVSEIPSHRHFIAEKGATVDGGLWVCDVPNASMVSTDELGRAIKKVITISTSVPVGNPTEEDAVWYVVPA